MADGPDIVVSASKAKRPPDQLTLVVSGSEISGWEGVEVTLLAEGFSPTFNISLSSKEPITSEAVIAKAGDDCSVLLGDDRVITGYVDRDITAGDAENHTITIMGRGKTSDLVDCSAEWPSDQLVQGTALDIATKLALPYSIGVQLGQGADAGPQVPPTPLNYTDTGAGIIQRVAQNAGLLAYESGDGKLTLATLGTAQAASGVKYGENVQAYSVENSMDGRYSDVVCSSLGIATLTDIPGSDFFDVEKDPNVPRHRQLNIVLEQVGGTELPKDFTIRKAVWEVSRRAGRASIVRVTVDSWRDSAGTLWTPNTLVPVDVPGMRVADKLLCLSSVTFRKAEGSGTTADLMLMPKNAFLPQPISLVPLNAADALGPGQ